MARRKRPSETNIPDTMKAAAIDRFGPPSVLRLHRLPVPHPGPNELLIAIDTAGVGSWDSAIRNGSWRSPGGVKFPLIPGTDGAGTVVAKGSRVTRFRLGDRVYGYEFGGRHGGFYAEYAAPEARHVGRVPRSLTLREAGSAATTGLTALQGVELLRIRRGETVLIFGASGAVGTLAVQFAVQSGARVIATASGRAAARLVRSLGAREVADARTAKGMAQLQDAAAKGLRAVLALAGGKALERVLALLTSGGRVVYPNGIEPEPRQRKNLRIKSFDAVASPREFVQLNQRFDRGRVRVPIAATYPLARTAQAHRRLESGHILGRIVLRVRQ